MTALKVSDGRFNKFLQKFIFNRDFDHWVLRVYESHQNLCHIMLSRKWHNLPPLTFRGCAASMGYFLGFEAQENDISNLPLLTLTSFVAAGDLFRVWCSTAEFGRESRGGLISRRLVVTMFEEKSGIIEWQREKRMWDLYWGSCEGGGGGRER
jgi:hypothetical protein